MPADTKGQSKIVTSLEHLLMESSFEGLLSFVQRLGLQYSLSGNIPRGPKQKNRTAGHFKARIFVTGVLKYEASSGSSMRAAFATALARFLILEAHDFHEYKGIPSDHSLDDQVYQ